MYSNRQQRRKAAAMGRRSAVSSATPVAWFSRTSKLPTDIKEDIYKVVSGVEFTGLDGGTCMWRNGVGYIALRSLGFETTFRIGGCLYRAGPNEVKDTISFCGPTNCGQFYNDVFLGHAWLEADEELIDFSCGDWKSELAEYDNATAVMGPLQWQVDPPSLIWCYKDTLSPWRATGSPALGDVWYGPWTGEHKDVGYLFDHLMQVVDGVKSNLRSYHLYERCNLLSAQ